MNTVRVEKIEIKVGEQKVVLTLDEARELHKTLSDMLGKGEANIVRFPPGFPKKLSEPIDISPPRRPNPQWPTPDPNATDNPPPVIPTITVCGTIPITGGSLP